MNIRMVCLALAGCVSAPPATSTAPTLDAATVWSTAICERFERCIANFPVLPNETSGDSCVDMEVTYLCESSDCGAPFADFYDLELCATVYTRTPCADVPPDCWSAP